MPGSRAYRDTRVPFSGGAVYSGHMKLFPERLRPMVRRLGISVLAGLVLLGVFEAASAQFGQRRQPTLAGNVSDTDGAEFTFARLMYGGGGSGFGRRGRGAWTTDMPEAEHFFMQGLTRLTRVDGAEVSLYNGQGAEIISLLDGNVFDFPFLYAVEVG